MKLTSSGEHVWSSYLGGNHDDDGLGIAVDASGNVLVTGSTSSSGWVSGGWDTTYDGGNEGEWEEGEHRPDYDAFVAELTPSGAHVWSSYLGGNGSELGYGIVADGSGNILVAGSTSSSGWVSGAWDTTHNGESDGFVVKLGEYGEGEDEGECAADSQAPVITSCPTDAGPFDLGSNCGVPLPDFTAEVVATDNCGTPTILQSPPAGTIISANTRVSLAAIDAAGLVYSCALTVTVEDTTPPAITQCAADPGPLSLYSDCLVGLPDLTADVVATDNCGALVITQSPEPGTMIASDTLITFTATDAAGLTDTCQVTLTVSPCEDE
ncbi:MAG: hypothetical protein GY842_01270, partial [bacterium]|nr:hypothetical protein [bacterium]